jgi:DNA-directed RNA polymerase specialized sigma24 family protein
LSEKRQDEVSGIESLPWKATDHRIKQTTVFIERFFNGTPYKELAERFEVKENTVVCMYRQGGVRVERLMKMAFI